MLHYTLLPKCNPYGTKYIIFLIVNLAGNLQFIEMSEDHHVLKNSSGNLACNDNTIEEPEQPADTLILQCSNCNTIIGDTTAWGCADSILRTVGLKCMSFL